MRSRSFPRIPGAASAAALALCLTFASSPAQAAGGDLRITALDDGERIPRDEAVALPESPYPDMIELFALRGEVVAFQVVIESALAEPRAIKGQLGPFVNGAASVAVSADLFAEWFVEIKRSTSTRGAGVGWTTSAEPDPVLLGFYADALVPVAQRSGAFAAAPSDVTVRKGERGALWVDLTVPESASPGVYDSVLTLSAPGASVERKVRLRVLPEPMPYASRPVITYYDPANLAQRMGSRKAEAQLRHLLHAHHVAAYRPVLTLADLEADAPYLSGAAYSEASGYKGPGMGRPEGLEVIAAYGTLGAPDAARMPLVEALAKRAAELKVLEQTYFDAGEEGPWPGGWRQLFDANPSTKPLKIWAACHSDPRRLDADAIIFLPEVFDPVTAAAAEQLGKQVWGQNGKRPYAGPTVLDAPAVDLRANSWISLRYGVARWTYWEATSWTQLGGGKSPDTDTDPFTVAESFRNARGNYSNGDGILVYPGRQVVPGMVDFGKDEAFPSVRLKNVRRGAQDVAYIELARAKDRAKADAVLERVVPTALRGASGPAAWPTRGRDFLAARRELAVMFADLSLPGPAAPAPAPAAAAAPSPGGCSTAPLGPGPGLALAGLGLGVAVALVARRRQRKL